jgi:hypothetical protein
LSVHKNNQGMKQTQEKFEDTKRIIICRKSKDRQYNGQKKKGQTNTSIPEIYKYSNTSIPEIYKNLFRFLISCLNKMYLLLLLEKIKKKLLL